LISGQLQHILPEYWQDADVWAVYPSRLKSSSKLQTCILFIQNELLNRLQHIQNLSRGQLIQPVESVQHSAEKVFL
jgi:LysR family transcriptional activator of dmlA